MSPHASRIKLRFSAILLTLLMAGFIWYTYHSYYEYKEQLYYEADITLLENAHLAASVLGDDFFAIQHRPGAISEEQNAKNEALLNHFTRESRIAYVYTMFQEGKSIRFGASSNTQKDHENATASSYYDRYDDAPQIIHDVFNDHVIRIHEYKDHWGEFRSLYLPVQNRAGQWNIVAADIEISYINQKLRHALIDFLLLPFLLILFIGGIGFYYIFLSRKTTHELLRTNHSLSQLRLHLEEKVSQQTHLVEMKNNELEALNTALLSQVSEEIEKNRLQEDQLLQKSRLAQLGEMISMIAHQWRQPLTAIASNVLDLKLKSTLNSFDLTDAQGREKYRQYLDHNLSDIESHVHLLTTTIDDFRNFYKADKEFKRFPIERPVALAVNIIKNSYQNAGITLIEEYRATRSIEMLDNELMQVVLNILKNAQDNFQERTILNPVVIITTTHGEGDNAIITICDNGGGAEPEVLSKMFDPYFSTKKERNGTGLGLYMSKIIIDQHHHGEFSAYNITNGICFKIELPGTIA